MNQKHIPAETRERIKQLLRRGETVANVHNRFADISLSTIKRYRTSVKAEQARKQKEADA